MSYITLIIGIRWLVDPGTWATRPCFAVDSGRFDNIGNSALMLGS